MSDDIIVLARRHKHIAPTHYEGCEADHIGCLVNKLADEIELLRAENERLHRAHDVACEGGERLHAKYNQLRLEIERLLQAFGLLTTTVPDMEIDIENAAGMAQRVMAKVDRQRAENERLREALRWYADPRNHFHVERRNPGDPDPAVIFIEEPPIMSDGGHRARNALEGKP